MTDDSTIRYVIDVVNNEGFGYAFMDYSDFREVEDPKFQELRKAFADAATALRKYLETFGEIEG